MNYAKIWLLIIILILVSGISYKTFIAPTNKTVISSGGRQVIINQDDESGGVPLVGCSVYKFRMKALYMPTKRLIPSQASQK